MQRAGIGFPIQFDPPACRFGLRIVRLNSQHTIQRGFFVSIAAKVVIAKEDLPEQENVARIKLDCSLQVPCGLFPAPLTALDVTLQLEEASLVGQRLASSFQFSQSTVIIDVCAIKMSRTREVCFASIWTEPKGLLNCCFGKRHTRRGMIVAKHRVKLVMSPSELAIRLKKCWVMRGGLVQQINRPQQIRFRATATGLCKANSQKKTLGAAIKIERCEIDRQWALDG